MPEQQGPHGEPLWHVTLHVSGEPHDVHEVAVAMERLVEVHPFLLTGRYGPSRADLRYWEEAPDLATAGDLAVQLWRDHQEAADLPMWHPSGIEILSQELHHDRFARGWPSPERWTMGEVHPF